MHTAGARWLAPAVSLFSQHLTTKGIIPSASKSSWVVLTCGRSAYDIFL